MFLLLLGLGSGGSAREQGWYKRRRFVNVLLAIIPHLAVQSEVNNSNKKKEKNMRRSGLVGAADGI